MTLLLMVLDLELLQGNQMQFQRQSVGKAYSGMMTLTLQRLLFNLDYAYDILDYTRNSTKITSVSASENGPQSSLPIKLVSFLLNFQIVEPRTCSRRFSAYGGDPPLIVILLKAITLQLPFLSRYCCQCLPSCLLEAPYTPSMCIAVRLSCASRCFG